MVALAVALAGCTGQDAETRAREAERKIRESIPDAQGTALAYKVPADQVKQAQEALKVLKEYLGEPNGRLDDVTVNAIEAFQHSQGVEADGVLDETTQRSLQEAAAKAGTTN